MSEILSIDGATVKLGADDGSIANLPIAVIQYANPQVGEKVKVYKDDDHVIVKRVEEPTAAPAVAVNPTERRVSKVAYILLCFFFGWLGVHRFMRGQIGLGIFMLLIGWWITAGIWPLVDFIISLVKLSKYEGDDYVFTQNGLFTK